MAQNLRAGRSRPDFNSSNSEITCQKPRRRAHSAAHRWVVRSALPAVRYNCRWMTRFKYLDTLVLVFVVVLLVSNLVAQKVCRLGPLTISGAELLFPITYIFGDVFTEVYGYRASRRAIWIGFFASALLSAAGAMAVALPADPGWHNQRLSKRSSGWYRASWPPA